MANKLTKSQRVMVEDGLPKECVLTDDEREEAWRDSPPRSNTSFFPDEKIEATKRLREQLQEEKKAKDKIRLEALVAKKKMEKFDPTGHRWDSRTNKWIPEDSNMPKWKIESFDSDGQIVQRGVTTMLAGAMQADVFAKMGAVYHRCAKDTVHKIVVSDPGGGLIREWTQESGEELPKPAPAAVDDADKTIKKAKAKGEKRVEKAVEKKRTIVGKTKKLVHKIAKSEQARAEKAVQPRKPPGQKGDKGPGIIQTILETIKRKEGASKDELLNVLLPIFPTHNEKSMRGTINVQCSKRGKVIDTNEKRGGKIYSFKG